MPPHRPDPRRAHLQVSAPGGGAGAPGGAFSGGWLGVSGSPVRVIWSLGGGSPGAHLGGVYGCCGLTWVLTCAPREALGSHLCGFMGVRGSPGWEFGSWGLTWVLTWVLTCAPGESPGAHLGAFIGARGSPGCVFGSWGLTWSSPARMRAHLCAWRGNRGSRGAHLCHPWSHLCHP